MASAVAHADALLKATPPEQRTDYKQPKPEERKGDPLVINAISME